MIEESLIRWLRASVNTHFLTEIQPYVNIKMYMEGQLRKTDADSAWGEIYVNGPDIEEQSHEYYKIYVGVHILYSVRLDTNQTYSVHDYVGKTVPRMKKISVFKLGDSIVDTGELLGCLLLDPLPGDPDIRITDFGPVNKDVALLQCAIEGVYTMTYEPNN